MLLRIKKINEKLGTWGVYNHDNPSDPIKVFSSYEAAAHYIIEHHRIQDIVQSRGKSMKPKISRITEPLEAWEVTFPDGSRLNFYTYQQVLDHLKKSQDYPYQQYSEMDTPNIRQNANGTWCLYDHQNNPHHQYKNLNEAEKGLEDYRVNMYHRALHGQTQLKKLLPDNDVLDEDGNKIPKDKQGRLRPMEIAKMVKAPLRDILNAMLRNMADKEEIENFFLPDDDQFQDICTYLFDNYVESKQAAKHSPTSRAVAVPTTQAEQLIDNLVNLIRNYDGIKSAKLIQNNYPDSVTLTVLMPSSEFFNDEDYEYSFEEWQDGLADLIEKNKPTGLKDLEIMINKMEVF